MVGDDLQVVAANREVCPTLPEIAFANRHRGVVRSSLAKVASTRPPPRATTYRKTERIRRLVPPQFSATLRALVKLKCDLGPLVGIGV